MLRLVEGGVRSKRQRELTSVDIVTIPSTGDKVLIVLKLPRSCEAMKFFS